jgi:4-amino-4-deoxychorismate lyase
MPHFTASGKNGQNSLFTSTDRIFLGEGLIETIRIENHQPCYSQQHWQRMQQSALRLNIPFNFSPAMWEKKLIQCIHFAELKTGGVRVLLGSTDAQRGLTARADASSLSCVAFSYPIVPHPVRLIRASWLRDANNPIYQFKSINYLEAIWACKQAAQKAADDVLFFNLSNHATETAIANFFIIKNNHVMTPLLTSGVLPGIIRHRLINLCTKSGVQCSETELASDIIDQADAAFVTNALQGIRVVNCLDGISFATHHPIIALLQQQLAEENK